MQFYSIVHIRLRFHFSSFVLERIGKSANQPTTSPNRSHEQITFDRNLTNFNKREKENEQKKLPHQSIEDEKDQIGIDEREDEVFRTSSHIQPARDENRALHHSLGHREHQLCAALKWVDRIDLRSRTKTAQNRQIVFVPPLLRVPFGENEISERRE